MAPPRLGVNLYTWRKTANGSTRLMSMQLRGTRPHACVVLSRPSDFQTGPAPFLSRLYQLTRFQAGRPVYNPADQFMNGPAVNNWAVT